MPRGMNAHKPERARINHAWPLAVQSHEAVKSEHGSQVKACSAPAVKPQPGASLLLGWEQQQGVPLGQSSSCLQPQWQVTALQQR